MFFSRDSTSWNNKILDENGIPSWSGTFCLILWIQTSSRFHSRPSSTWLRTLCRVFPLWPNRTFVHVTKGQMFDISYAILAGYSANTFSESLLISCTAWCWTSWELTPCAPVWTGRRIAWFGFVTVWSTFWHWWSIFAPARPWGLSWTTCLWTGLEFGPIRPDRTRLVKASLLSSHSAKTVHA